ncbi:MAG: molybdenum cofactor guanylyltransferase [Bacteroidales bacterium]|nr:molybdenum cofactor guanylyltransferase [Bacteroidales bacterium]
MASIKKFKNITLIILAGGKSSRMGTDKALLKFQGKTFVQILYDNLNGICKEVIISSNNRKVKVSGAKTIPDEIANIGPTGGLYTCLKQIKTDYAFVVTVDTPFVSVDLLSEIYSKIAGYDVVIIEQNNKIHPLIGVYHKNIIKLLETEIEEKKYKVMKVVEKTKHRIISVSGKYKGELFNINSRKDFDKLNT